MSNRSITRALVSVYDKTGLVEFIRPLVEQWGIRILSTGGTAEHLTRANIPVELVETITGFGELLSGRVKTLHPAIHAAILADRSNPDHVAELARAGIEPIDMVVVGFYPFARAAAEPLADESTVLEMIDIGGPTMLRAAAKNYRHVLPVPGVGWYGEVLKALRDCRGNDVPVLFRRRCAQAAFEATNAYDQAIAGYFDQGAAGTGVNDPAIQAALPTLDDPIRLRYGENPHQAGWFRPAAIGGETWRRAIEQQSVNESSDSAPSSAFSFNNLLDADAALSLCHDVARSWHAGDSAATGSAPSAIAPAVCVFVKHNNPCGVGVYNDPVEAYRRAYLGDPAAAMGGILACSFPIDEAFAETVMDTAARWGRAAGAGGFFVEVWVAPAFDESAIQIVRQRKSWGERVRFLATGDGASTQGAGGIVARSIHGGLVFQSADAAGLNSAGWRVVSRRPPTADQWGDLRLAWLAAKHSKSNAISVCRDGMLIGNGVGQASRVMSCRLATWLATQNGHADALRGSSAASDGFFPFADGPEILVDAGVTAIIQPGGSKRDADTIALCDDRDVSLVLTGTRHFRH